MDMTQLFAAFPQLSMMGGQKQMTTGTPQMLQLGIDPNAGANLEADKANWQRNAQMANILMQQGGDYIPNSGRAGILAGLASLIRGKMMESGQEDTLRDILQRQFKQDNEAAAAKHAQDLEDEDRKLRGEIFKGRELKKADLEFAPSQYAAGLGAFDPRTGQVTIDPNISAAKLAEKQAELALGAKYRAGPGPSGLQKAQAEIQEAVKAGLITPEEGMQRLRQTVLGNGEKGAAAPSGYQWKPDGSGLVPISGGPADPASKPIPPDLAGKVSLAQGYLEQFPGILKDVEKGTVTGPIDATVAEKGYGRGGEVYRQIQSGRDALQRTLTGAGMPASEAGEYADRYLPTLKDNSETLASKQRQLQGELSRFVNIVKTGGDITSILPSAAKAPAGGMSDEDLLKKYGGL